MVELQDAVTVAFFVSLVVNILQAVYGPLAKRREFVRQARTKLAIEIAETRQSANTSAMAIGLNRLESWKETRDGLPRRYRRELDPFVALCDSYWGAYERASGLVELAIYKSVAQRTDLPALPPTPPKGSSDPMWIVQGPGPQRSRMSKRFLEEALVDVLSEPLLRGEKVRWTTLTDSQPEFCGQLLEVTDTDTVNRIMEEIDVALERNAGVMARPREIRRAIKAYRLPLFPPTA